jgi:DNA-binding SARP family transcriptional activator/tetratricopeptide (TPR) repeat protein
VRVCVLGHIRGLTGEHWTLPGAGSDGDPQDAVALGGARQRAVLAALVFAGQTPIEVDQIAHLVWGSEIPRTVAHTVQGYVFRLRQAGVPIESSDSRYRLAADTDIAEVHRLAARARTLVVTSPAQAAGLYEAAVALFRGEPYLDLDNSEEIRAESERLVELRESCAENAVAAGLAAGRGEEVLSAARALVAGQPFRERRWELLMTALYRSGRQGEALDTYGQVRSTLVSELGVEPGPSLQRLQASILSQDPRLDAWSPGTDSRGNRVATAAIPAYGTALIGRRTELKNLVEAATRSRLVTLVGPAGAGKSRLLAEYARSLPATVWSIRVERLDESTSLAAALLDEVAPQSSCGQTVPDLIEALGAHQDGVMVLDGCEGRTDEVCTTLTAILAARPTIVALVSTRERLGLPDEALVPISGLSDDDALDFLTERARLVRPNFALTDRAAGLRLCHCVDSLPLGIELVAQHLGMFSVADLADRVTGDLRRWTSTRADDDSGLWSALRGSVEQLPAAEHALLNVMSCLVSDADLSLIGAVSAPAGTAESVVDALRRLSDLSLVQARMYPSGIRYGLLESVRSYVSNAADPAGLGQASIRYADAVLARCAELGARLRSRERASTVTALDSDLQHVRYALNASLADPVRAAAALEAVVDIGEYWIGRRPAEGLRWVRALADRARPIGLSRARSELSMGHFMHWLAEFDGARNALQKALAIYTDLGNEHGQARTLRRLGSLYIALDDFEQASDLTRRALVLCESSGDDAETAATLLQLGVVMTETGQVNEALPLLARAQKVAACIGDPLGEAQALGSLCVVLCKAGELAEAMRAGELALAMFEEIGFRPSEGPVAARMATAARLMGCSGVAREHAERALAAGTETDSRTTVGLARIVLARLALDDGDAAGAADQLSQALDDIDPVLDRWVLAECLEAGAAVMVARHDPQAVGLLGHAAAIRADIHLPVPVSEQTELASLTAAAERIARRPVTQLAVDPDVTLIRLRTSLLLGSRTKFAI